jgi:hypothetical protein
MAEISESEKTRRNNAMAESAKYLAELKAEGVYQ